MKKLTPILLALGLIQSALAGVPFDLNLYPAAPPGAELSSEPDVVVVKPGDPVVICTHVQTPTVRVYLPRAEKQNGVACVIVPGGGYQVLAINHEGYQAAERLRDMGITAVVLKHRVSDKVKYHHPVPIMDVRQSIRLVRQQASAWKVDPNKVGVLGFSAGGHLASCALTLAEEKFPEEAALTGEGAVSHRPDFGVLLYPVISFTESYTHEGSRRNLLGDQPSPELMKKLSTDLQVNAQTPPTLLFATQEDKAVPAMNAISFYLAMQKHGVPGELHVWEKGRHGFGLLSDWGEIASAWPTRLEQWLIGRQLMTAAQ
jgi:acetyl esterase/lipase